MKKAWGLLLLAGLWVLQGMVHAAMNPGEESAVEITHERDNVQSMTPEQIRANIYEARARKNAELKAYMQKPPLDFPHYANPPIHASPKKTWQEKMLTIGEPLPLLIIKTLAFIIVGALLLSWIIHRLTHQPAPATEQK